VRAHSVLLRDDESIRDRGGYEEVGALLRTDRVEESTSV